MRKFKLILATMAAVMLLSVMAGPAFAGGRQGADNGNSANTNIYAVCHEAGDMAFTLWVGDEDSRDDHTDHGDALGECAD